ncbi:MAG: hypothetical protein EPO22_06030 [Dehalococcoidia bacterium]|nr:MAG: hypothetical protein EPO22_06030 [Dehalococcoidia bacterium]
MLSIRCGNCYRPLAFVLAAALVAVAACGEGDGRDLASPTSQESVVASPTPSASPEPSAAAPAVGVFVVRADGSGLRRVFDVDALLQTWSPDSTTLAFVDRLNPGHEITLLNLASGEARRLGPMTEATLAWSPRGNELLVTSLSSPAADRSAPHVLEIVDVKMGDRSRIGEAIAGEWSPDGNRIAMAGMTCESRFVRHIYDVTTKTTTDVLQRYPGAAAFISPDWKRMAYFKSGGPFLSDRAADNSLYVSNIDGTDEHALATGDIGRGEPFWSPDGRWIAYTPRLESPNGFAYTPYLLSADGSRAPIKLARQGDTGVWSPDSRLLVLHDAKSPTDQFDDLHLVYELSDGQTSTFHTGPAYHEQWSPSGKQIAFVAADHSGRTSLGIYDVRTNSTTVVPGMEGIIPANPRWSPDATRLSFLGIPGGYDYGPCL